MTALDLSAPVPVPITKRGWFIRLVQLGVIAFFVVAWEVLGQLGVLDKFYYSRPSLFIARIAQWFGEGLGPTSIWIDMRVTLLEVLLPAAFSAIVASLRTSAGFAFAGAVVAEYIGSNAGLGRRIATAEAFFDSTGVFGGIVVIAVLALILDFALQWVEGAFSRWKPRREH